MGWQVRTLANKTDTFNKLQKHFKSPSLNFLIDEYGCCYMCSDKFDSFMDDSYV